MDDSMNGNSGQPNGAQQDPVDPSAPEADRQTESERPPVEALAATLEATIANVQHLHATLRGLLAQGRSIRAEARGVGRSGVGPEHSAIVLSEPPRMTAPGPPDIPDLNIPRALDRLDAALAASTQGLPRVDPNTRAPENDYGAAVQAQMDAVSQDANAARLTRQRLVRRRSLLEMQFRRNHPRIDAQADDGSTTLGRRVAARVAALQSGADEGSNTSSNGEGTTSVHSRRIVVPSVSQLEANAASYFWDPAELTAPSRYTHAAYPWRPTGSAFRARYEQIRNSTPMFDVPVQLPPLNHYLAPQVPDEVTVTPNDEATSSGRPRILYRPVPPSELISPHTQRQQPIGTRAQSQDSGSETPGDTARGPLAEHGMDGHTYRIRRNFTADGEELVHRIRTDDWWDDDDSDPSGALNARERERSRIVTSTSLRTRYNRVVRPRPPAAVGSGRDAQQTANSQPATVASAGSRRRRGWARLNADGDEIDTDEEEAEERLQAEIRTRRTNLAQMHANSAFRASYALVSYPSDGRGSPIHVRLNFPSMNDGHHHRTEDQNSSAPVMFGTDVPYEVDPLPLPLSYMMPHSSVSDHEPQRPVSSRAHMAAR